MEKVYKKELLLEGLHCANCANKIEDKINGLEEVSAATLNFATKKLIIETNIPEGLKDIMPKVQEIVNKLEPGVVVKEAAKKVGKIQGKGKVNAHGHSHDHDHSHNHEHDHDHSEDDTHDQDDAHSHHHHGSGDKKELIKLGVGVGIFLIPTIFNLSYNMELILYLISYIIVGGEVLYKAGRNIIRGQVFDENFLMGIATIGAFAIKEFPEAVSVMIFYSIGELFQDMAVNNSRKSIAALMDIRPDYANKKIGNEYVKASPEEVNVGDIIIVRPGEKVPLDGVVIEGSAMVDTSAITGESVPRQVKSEDDILSGFINKDGVITLRVAKEFGESTVSKILDLVQNAGAKKAQTEKFITKFARYYTPAVVLLALALAVIPPMVIPGATFSQWIYRALVFLVVSCPCALVVSIPLGFFGGIGAASRKGILIKGGNYLEALNNVNTVVFDKTGTLTKGVFKVTEIKNEPWIKKEELLKYAALAESFSNHPIAQSIIKEYGNTIDNSLLKDYKEISGHGLKVSFGEEVILAGNGKLMRMENIEFAEADNIGTVVYIAINQRFAGYILISDEIKEDSKKAIEELGKLGINNTVMLTGDRKPVADFIGKTLNIHQVQSELLPTEKVESIERLFEKKKDKEKIIFVGDGINDAPVLARADIGIAMGGVGSDAAIEAADIVIMTDEPSKIAEAISIAKNTNKVVWQNIIFALAIKAVILVLGAVGIASMWEAVFGDVGVALLAVLNSMRVLKAK